jgi:predicted peroxiredoxin
MKLGILINTDRHADDVVGLTKAALSKGHEVIIFMMDGGNRLLGNTAVTGLSNESGVSMAFCDHSAQKLGISKEGIPGKINCGSQFDNANMNSRADRIIVL